LCWLVLAIRTYVQGFLLQESDHAPATFAQLLTQKAARRNSRSAPFLLVPNGGFMMTTSAHSETDPLCSWLMLHWTRSICTGACDRRPHSNTCRANVPSGLCYAANHRDLFLHCIVLVHECKACTMGSCSILSCLPSLLC